MDGSIFQSTFTLGRTPPFPSLYPENKTAVSVDVLEVGWIVAFLTLYFCYLIIIPALPGKERFFYFLRVTLSLALGLVIVVCLFGQEWEVGHIEAHEMAYKAGSHETIDGVVGLKLGLRSVNITLKAISQPTGQLEGEKIDYNERFYFSNGAGQGRAGFGPFAAEINQEFRAAQFRGAPYPILWVAEYFTFDGEGLRFGRNYRLAGFYSSICIWTCFPLWILTVILFKMVISYGAIMLTLLGTLLLLSSLIWSGRRNFLELNILFSDTEVLKTSYGVNWYLATIVGVLCIISGLLIYFLDKWWHKELCKLFGINPFNIFEEEYGADEEETTPRVHVSNPEGGESLEMTQMKQTRGKRTKISFRLRGQSKLTEKTFQVFTPEYNQAQNLDSKQTDTNDWLYENDGQISPNYPNYGEQPGIAEANYDDTAIPFQDQDAYYDDLHPGGRFAEQPQPQSYTNTGFHEGQGYQDAYQEGDFQHQYQPQYPPNEEGWMPPPPNSAQHQALLSPEEEMGLYDETKA